MVGQREKTRGQKKGGTQQPRELDGARHKTYTQNLTRQKPKQT